MNCINTLSSAGCLACRQATKKLRTLHTSSHLMLVEIGQTQLQLVTTLPTSDTLTLVTRDSGHGQTRRTKGSKINY